MSITVIACWLIASTSERKRKLAFWAYLFSNALWIAWGVHDQALALIVLQLALAVLNIRGAYKNALAERLNAN